MRKNFFAAFAAFVVAFSGLVAAHAAPNNGPDPSNPYPKHHWSLSDPDNFNVPGG
jgi:hypothetical protein